MKYNEVKCPLYPDKNLKKFIGKRTSLLLFIFIPGKYNPITVNLSHFIYGKCNYMLFSMPETESDSLGVLTGAFRFFEAAVGGIK